MEANSGTNCKPKVSKYEMGTFLEGLSYSGHFVGFTGIGFFKLVPFRQKYFFYTFFMLRNVNIIKEDFSNNWVQF